MGTGMWTMIILLLLRLFCATDHLSFLCLMTLAHIVCWSRCNTDIQMTLSDNDTFREGPFGMDKKPLNICILLLSRLAQLVPCLPKQIGVSLWIADQFYVHILSTPPGLSVESIYYQSAQHVLASPDFWAIL